MSDERLTYRGQTTVYGELLRIEPHTGVPTAHLRFHTGVERWVTLTPHVASGLAERVGETVGLIGTAVWDAATNEMVRFDADALSPYRDRDPGMDRPRTIEEAFQSLAEASNGCWDDIDPDEFVRQLREGDDEQTKGGGGLKTADEWNAEALANRRELWWFHLIPTVSGAAVFFGAMANLIADRWTCYGAIVGAVVGVLLRLRDWPSASAEGTGEGGTP